MGLRIYAAGQIDKQIDADDLNEEEHPFARPEPDEAVNESGNAARARNRCGKPNAGTRDGTQHVAEDEKKETVAANETEINGPVLANGIIGQPRKQDAAAN